MIKKIVKKRVILLLALTLLCASANNHTHYHTNKSNHYLQDYYLQQAKSFLENSQIENSVTNAIESYKKVIDINPNHFFAHFNCANLLLKVNENHEAYELYEKASHIQPECPQVYFNMGIILQLEGEYLQAIKQYKKAIELKPAYIKALIQLGTCCKEEKLFEDALNYFYNLLDIEPNNIIAHTNIAKIYYEKELFDAALYHYHIAARQSNNSDLLNEYAGILGLINNNKKALKIYKELLEKHPDSAEICYNIANSLKRQKKLGKALYFYEKALKLNPNSDFIRFGMGLAYLTAGDFTNGWKLYEHRWAAHNIPKVQLAKPIWDGSPLQNKTLFIYTEQGLGDAFQFIRYAQVAKQMGATVLVSANNALVPLLSLCPYIDEVNNLSHIPKLFDYHCPLLSMPYLCKTTIETIPCDIPYLYADSALVTHWNNTLKTDPNFKIGVCWQGNKNFKTKILQYIFKSREVALHYFEPLFNLKKISVYSLQKIIGEEQISKLENPHKLKIFTQDFDNTHGRFMDTAAVIKNLDLVITVDTSIAHLAGALGVPVWVLIPEPGDFRWMINIDYSPWYPTMKLFRQKVPGNWEYVMQDVIQELQKILSQRGAP